MPRMTALRVRRGVVRPRFNEAAAVMPRMTSLQVATQKGVDLLQRGRGGDAADDEGQPDEDDLEDVASTRPRR